MSHPLPKAAGAARSGAAPTTVGHPLGLPVPSRLAHLRAGFVASAVVAVPAASLGGLYAGAAGVIGALAAVAVVALSFVLSTLAVAAADARDPQLVLPVGLTTYVVKVVVLGVVAFTVADGHAAWHPVTGWTVVAATIAWAGAQAWWYWHVPRPYVVLPEVLPRCDEPRPPRRAEQA